jgi:hypothetical protein
MATAWFRCMMGQTAGGMIKDWCETGVAVFTGTVEEIPRPAHGGVQPRPTARPYRPTWSIALLAFGDWFLEGSAR